MLENSQPLLLQIFLQLFSLLILLLVFPLYVWYIFCSCSTVLGQSVFFFPLFDSALKAFIEISNWLFSWPCLIYWWAHRRHGHSSFLLGHFNFFLVSCTACVILVPRPEIEPMPLALEMQILNHWTTREVLLLGYFWFLKFPLFFKFFLSCLHYQFVLACCLPFPLEPLTC